jgi:hypothetical protein
MVDAEQKLVDPLPSVSDDTKRQIRSILDVLNQVDGLQRLRPLFAGKSNDPFSKGETGWSLHNAIVEAMNLNQFQTAPSYVSFTANRPGSMDITGASRLLGPVRALYSSNSATGDEVSATFDNAAMTIRWGERNWTIAAETLMEKAESGRNTEGSPLRIAVSPDVDMFLTELYGDKGEQTILRGATFWLVVRE